MATVNCTEYANYIASPPVMNAPNTRGKLIRQRFSYTVAAVVAVGTIIVLGVLPANSRFYGGVWSNDDGLAALEARIAIGVTGTAAKFYAALDVSDAVDQTPFGVTVALGGGGTYVPTADILVIATVGAQVIVTAGTLWGWFDYVLA
jgi:hypothetical protein